MTNNNSTMRWVAAAALALAVAAVVGIMAAAAPAKASDVPKWTGVYVGASLGYGSAKTEAGVDITGVGNLATIDGLGSAGHSLGLVLGADVQIDRLVLGVFADWVRHDQTWNASAPLLAPGNLATLDIESQWTIGGRAGLAVGNALIYGLVGYTTVQTSDLSIPPAAVTLGVPDLKGWALGGGVDVALGQGISAGIEYRYTDLGSESIAIDPGVAALRLDPQMHEVRARLTYKLGVDGILPK